MISRITLAHIVRIILFCVAVVLFASCARTITIEQAAQGGYKKCRNIR